MKLILLDGGPASGKSTLGKLLVNDLNAKGNKSILLDLDRYIEKYCPKWIWENPLQKKRDLASARIDFKNDINKFLQKKFDVIVIGERFLTKTDISKYTNSLKISAQIYLYHLSVPFDLRDQRLKNRGPHSLIDLEKDQKTRDAIKLWPGYVYQNINSPEIDASNLLELIMNKQGEIKINA